MRKLSDYCLNPSGCTAEGRRGFPAVDKLLRFVDCECDMERRIQELDVVALLKGLPERKLVAGQVGTVVEILGDGVFEVDFSDDEGTTYATLALREEDLIVLHYSPVAA